MVTVDTVSAYMPFLMVTKCQIELIYLEMVIIHNETFQNLATIASLYGNDQAEFIKIMMPDTSHLQCFKEHFTQPND